jgi:hypothetical protein
MGVLASHGACGNPPVTDRAIVSAGIEPSGSFSPRQPNAPTAAQTTSENHHQEHALGVDAEAGRRGLEKGPEKTPQQLT